MRRKQSWAGRQQEIVDYYENSMNMTFMVHKIRKGKTEGIHSSSWS